MGEQQNTFGAKTDDYIIETAAVDDNNIASITVLVEKEFPVDPSLFSKHWAPDIGIPVKTMGWSRAKGLHQFRFNYEGVSQANASFAETQVQFEIDYAMEDVGLMAFPRFSTLKKKYGLRIDESGQIVCPETMPGDPKTPNELYGVENFQIAGLIWRKMFVSRVLNAREFDRIGLIDRPEGGLGQEAPDLTGRANWRLVGAGGRWAGNIWSLRKEWLASGDNGWLADLYASRIAR
jgi:hypothetical protein